MIFKDNIRDCIMTLKEARIFQTVNKCINAFRVTKKENCIILKSGTPIY